MNARKFAGWALFVGLCLPTPAWSQGGGGGGGGANLGSGGGGGGNSGAGGNNLGFSLSSLSGSVSGPSTNLRTFGSGQNALQTSNLLRSYYGNPYYQGLNNGTNPPGNFGSVLFGRTTTTAASGGSATVTSSTSGGGSSSARVAYAAVVRFARPVAAPGELQDRLQGLVQRSTQLTNPQTVEIAVQGRQVWLRGTVANPRERRHVESIVRLTPGVSSITNELVPATTDEE
jgi:hypothetical protein